MTTPTDLRLDPARARSLRGLMLALLWIAGLVAGVAVLAIEPIADFLGEGAVRVLGLDGGGRRLVIGVGLIGATAVTALALGRGRGRARYVLAGAGVAVALFVAGPLALPVAAAAALAVVVERVAGLSRAQLAQAAPRRHPAAWAAGAVAGIVVIASTGWVGWRLTAPLFDAGRQLDEQLAFAIATPAAGDTAAPVATAADGARGDGAAAGTAVAEGELIGVDSFHTGSGRVLLARSPDGAGVLRFEDYAVRNGPDLRIYLTPDPDGDVFAEGAVDLGPIKATRGNVNYDVPADADLATFRTAVVYCFGFRVTFATAALD